MRADVAGTFADGLALAQASSRYDLVVLDYMLPDGNGLDLIPPIRALRPAPTVLMMTAFGTIENAVEAMRRGAYDYVTKSTELPAIVERVVDAEKVARARVDAETTAAIGGRGSGAVLGPARRVGVDQGGAARASPRSRARPTRPCS